MLKLSGEEREYSRRWWTFLVLALAILIVVIDHTILNVALPTLQQQLGSTTAQLQWIIAVIGVAGAIVTFLFKTRGE